MKLRSKRIFRLCERILHFFETEELPVSPAALSERLDSFKERVANARTALTKRKTGGEKSSSRSRTKLIVKDEILKDHIDPLRTLIRAMGKGKKKSKLLDDLIKDFPPVPATGNEEDFIASIQSYINKADIYREQFIAHGAEDSFIDDLQAKLDEFRTASSERQAGFIGRLGGKEETDTELDEAYKETGFFDAIMKRILPRNHPKRVIWERISKLEKTLPPEEELTPELKL